MMWHIVVWVCERPGWQRAIIGAAIGGPIFILVGETGRWLLGKGFFQ